MAETTNPMVRRLALSLLSAYRPQVGVMAATRPIDQRTPVHTVDAVTVWVANTLAAPDEALARIVLPQLLARFEQLFENEHQGGSAWPR